MRTASILIIIVLISNLLPAQGTKFEAEDATLSGVSKASSLKGYSGTGYVTGFDNSTDKIVLTFNWENEGKYELLIGYASPNGDKNNYVIVNGQTLGDLLFPYSTGFKEMSAGNISLNKGSNTISIVNSWGWFNVDYIRIDKSKQSASWNISPEPINPNITPAAKSMYHYLLNNFGKTTFTGQYQSEDKWYTDKNSEIYYIKNTTGKYPALYGNDLIDYSPSRIEHGATSNATTDIVNWYKEKTGMVTVMWHWNAPTDLPDTNDQPWWSGFYTRATNFDIAWVLNNPQSEKYQLLLRDIDAIADQLKILQENNIPVLWRPLHEAEGAWFWWGAKGPEACVKLWKLLYDRLTNFHKINNLIWIWTTSDSPKALNWYPGDDYVDILGVDVYLSDGDYSVSSAMFDNLRNIFKGKKMLAMSENGTLPDPEKMKEQEARWLYNCTWVGDFIFDGKKNSQTQINYFFNHSEVTTLDELPANWSTFTSSKEINQALDVNIFPNPSTNRLNFVFKDKTCSKNISVFNQNGKMVFIKTTYDSCSVDTSKFRAGVYIIRIEKNNAVQTYKIVKK
jgi:mannan endo-1,4-beta-mannosidase